jgi:hypothetical protein
LRLVLTVTTPHTELSSRRSLLSIFWSYRGGLFVGFAGKKGTRLVILLHTERIRMLQHLTDHLAAAVKVVDAEMPVARNKRSGVPLAAGLGPHSEAETFNLIVREAERAHPDAYLSVVTSVPYPNAPRQRCDLKLTTPTATLYVEGKLLRLKGDNGKPNDNMLMHILSPYPQHRSALTDCVKLSDAFCQHSRNREEAYENLPRVCCRDPRAFQGSGHAITFPLQCTEWHNPSKGVSLL